MVGMSLLVPENCPHERFRSDAQVVQVTDRPGMYAITVRVRCAQCGNPFVFKGLKEGMDMQGAFSLENGLALRAPIYPFMP